jgi:hypothetical protein
VLKTRITSRKNMVEAIRETVIRFNRDTGWLATGLVGTVVFAAIVLAVQEHRPNAKPAESDPAPLAIATSSSPNGELTLTQDSSVNRALVKTSLEEKGSSSRNESAIPASGLAFRPEERPQEHRQDSTRLKGSRTPNERNRSSVALSTAEVKRRLIELWHQSLAKNEKSRSWTAFSHLNRGAHKKAAYTAEMSH